MSNAFIIEIDDLEAGILVSEGTAYRFHAATDRFFGLQGQHFAGPASAERAARDLLRRRPRPKLTAEPGRAAG